ncbi:MAG TPA: ATP-binding cassette domain-containing protein [Gaiellaceae bacterium]|nr:ATP-binding cassette domain-containing protein [Gaiellaceae bacterium]
MNAELRGIALSVSVERGVLFDGLDVTARSGHVLAITGPSGSGKTTLAHVLGGVRPPDRGVVLLDGAPLAELAPGWRPSLVPQDYGLVGTLTAAETVALPLQVQALARPEIRERTSRRLRETGLDACASRAVDELSGGQRQRVAIARALASAAPVLVLDEPTSELDAANRDIVLALLAGEARQGRILVVVSHDPDVLARSDARIELGR